MGTWSTEFINLAEISRMDILVAHGLAAWIARRVAASAGASRRGIVLYFPPHPTPGLDARRTDAWVLESHDPIVLPPEVEVRIAPGAKITLWGLTRLEVHGAFTAPVEQVFELPRLVTATSSGIGDVSLLGDRIECVHPEWWGAGQGDAEVDTEALQHAVHVAMRRPRPLPIELLGCYTLRRTLMLSQWSNTAPFQGVELRGRFSSGDATFRAADDFFAVGAMVLVPHTTLSSLLHAVSFDARGRALRCLEFYLTGSSVPGVTQAPHTLQQCTFRGATTAQVDLTRGPIVPSSGLPVPSPVPRLVASGCVFAPTATSVGVRLGWTPDAVAAFSGCTFAGEARAMVHVRGQGATLTNCRFHNTLVPERLRNASGSIDWREVHQTAPEGGLDIFVDRESYRVQVPQQKEPQSALGALGWVTAQDCRSSSLQHVAVARHTPAPSERVVRDSVVIGLHHACNPLPSGLARNRLPPAILWRAPAAQGGALSLMGCRFDGLDRSGSPRVVVLNNPSMVRPALFEYGTCSRDRIVRTAEAAVDNDDVFQAQAIGRIPFPPPSP